MKGIKWFKGANYYVVRGWLEKRGFYKADFGFDNEAKTSGWCKMSNGSEDITLYCTISTSANGNLKCDTVTGFKDYIYD